MKIKVRCKGYKRGEKYFTIGKVYEWEDGRLTNDRGNTYKYAVNGKNPKEWDLSNWYDFEVVQDQKIVITTDGEEIHATLYEDKKPIKTAKAKCSPDDTFDFATGAKLAFERLMGEAKEAPENVKWRVVNRKPKVGDYIRLKTKNFSFNEIGDILKVDIVKYDDFVSVYGKNHNRDTGFHEVDWNYIIGQHCEIVEPVNPEKVEEKFTPYIYSTQSKKHYGNIGDLTNYKDAIGRPLCIGDVVEVFGEKCRSYGDNVVVKDDGKAFVMGCRFSCDDKNGTTGNWKLIKKRSFEGIENGETINGIKYVKESK